MTSLKNILKKAIVATVMLTSLAYNAPIHKNNLDINKIYLTSCVNDGIYSTESKNATLEDKVMLNLVVESNINGKRIYFSESNNVSINGENLDSSVVEPEDLGHFLIKWYKIESKRNKYNNGSNESFHWDTPVYKETLIDNGDNWTMLADAHPTNVLKDVNEGLGTMRYKVEFIYNNKKFSTPGKESVNLQGITEDVHRISFRKGDDFIGWLTSFFNLPYIYGSDGKTDEDHQTEKNIGADCADLIVGAYRKMGNNIPYTYSVGLIDFTNTIIEESDLFTDGENFYNSHKLVKYGDDVKNGDLILFGKWHVGVIAEDKSNPKGFYKGKADGIFNKYDLMIHTLFDTPSKDSMGDYGRFSILRWKDK